MGMVTLVQHCQQSAQDGTRDQHQKDQDAEANTPVVSCDNETRGEILQVAKNTAVDVVRDESLAGSSTQCSDVENDEGDETEADEGEWIPDLPVPTLFQKQQQEIVAANGNLVLPNADTSNFGDVRVKNSTNVHLGNKTFYKGPVTIKQFVYTNPGLQDLDEIKVDNTRASDTNTTDFLTKGDSSTSNSIVSQNSNKATKWLWTWQCSACLSVLALFFVTVVVIVTVYYARNVPTSVYPQLPDSGSGGKPSKVRFVTRNEWGAQPPSEPLEPLKHPVPYVIVSHTATEFCLTQADCTFRVRFAQTFHIESRKWSDIGYNFLVGGDGLAYVGRGWDFIGAFAFGYNNRSIGISCIGTFNSLKPSKSQLYALQRVIETGVELGKIAKDYKLLGHRQVSSTLSPGEALFLELVNWPHWSPTP